jgi:RNA polymerase sigma-70 factor (ECF subfamily)
VSDRAQILDSATVQAFAAGEEEAFATIFRTYFAPLCLFARDLLPERDAAEDIVQDCFMRLWQKHTVLKEPSQIRSFLYTVVRNACISRWRKEKGNPVVSLEINDVESNLSNESEATIKAEMLSWLMNELEHLPERIREVCQLYYFEGLDERTISRQLGTSLFTVRGQRKRGIQILRAKKFP